MHEPPKTTGHDRREVMTMAEAQGTGNKAQQAADDKAQQNAQQAVQQPAAQTQQVQQPAQPEPAESEQPKAQQTKTEQPETTDRTRQQFEKLLESNKKLYEANELLRRELGNRALSNQQFMPVQQQPIQQQPAQVQQQVNPDDFIEVDPVTGERFIDDKKLQAKITDLNSRASKAEEAVQKYIQTAEQREIDRQNREAFSSYPELNPSDPGFDVTFHNQTRALIYDSLINPQDYKGRPMSFKEAADFVKQGKTAPATEENQQTAGSQGGEQPKTGEQQPAEGQNQTTGDELKQQASAGVAGETPQQREVSGGSEELQRLQEATRLGSQEALARRIANTDHILKKEEGEQSSS